MRVLLLHNRYLKSGGEDAALESEYQLLRARGHEVRVVFASNKVPEKTATLALAWNSSWSRNSFDTVRELCREFRPDIAHVHNFWMSWTPSVHAACRGEGVATVQTLHNFRLFCANAVCLRNERPCQDCLGRSPWLGAARRCYRNSVFASALVARMISANRRRETWETEVNAFIVPGEHARSLYLQAGLPADRLFVKPNVVGDLGPSPRLPSESRTIAYSGRLSEEKGIGVLLDAWKRARRPADSRLLLIGEEQIPGTYSRNAPADVTFTGRIDPDKVSAMLESVRAVVAPSLCYETFGMSVVEAYSKGRGAIASDLGSLADLVDHGRTGLKFASGDAGALARQIELVLSAGALSDMLGANARMEYLRRFSTDRNYQQLMHIYSVARGGAAVPVPSALGAAE
jgi:glycosyltransferase involved in cell wall biosynthesis